MKINVYIGTSKETIVAEEVLKYTILKYNDELNVKACPKSTDFDLVDFKYVATPFSFNRLSIPFDEEFLDYDWAIYLDSDMMLFDDLSRIIGECSSDKFLNVIDMPSTNWQSSVLIFNCSLYDEGKYRSALASSIQLGGGVDEVIGRLGVASVISSKWNSLDFITEETKLVHFTYMPTQPWINMNSRYRDLFRNVIIELLHSSDSLNADKFKGIVVLSLREGFINPKLINKELSMALSISRFKIPVIFVPYWFGLRIKGNLGRIFRGFVRIIEKIKKNYVF